MPRRHGFATLAATAFVVAACDPTPSTGDSGPTPSIMTDSSAPTPPSSTAPSDATGSAREPRGDAVPARIPYGDAPEQFGDFSTPGGDDRPVVVLIHGGFWRNPFDLTLMNPLADDLVARGYAVWNIEYRRIGDDGGGWPGTFDDVAAAVDHLADLATDASIDLDRVAIVGHSAGGHLALWAAGRTALSAAAPGAGPRVVPAVAIGQGAVVDLDGAADAPLGNGAVIELLGGAPAEVPERYDVARPRPDAGPRYVSVVGTVDDIVPPPFSTDPVRPGAIEVVTIDGADHFDLIDRSHEAWTAVVDVLDQTVGVDVD